MIQRRPPPRLGLDQFPARAVRALVAREHRADGRRRGDARISRSAPAPSWRWKARSRWPTTCTPSRPGGGVRANTRTSGASRCCGCSRRRATRSNGSRRSSAISHLDPVQFNYSLLTRSQRISHENLRLRDPEWLGGAEAWFQRQAGGSRNVRARADVRAVPAARPEARRTASSSRRWRSTRRSTAARPTGISSTTPSAPRAAPGWSTSR